MDALRSLPQGSSQKVFSEVIREVWYNFLDNRQALTLAIDIKDNYENIIVLSLSCASCLSCNILVINKSKHLPAGYLTPQEDYLVHSSRTYQVRDSSLQQRCRVFPAPSLRCGVFWKVLDKPQIRKGGKGFEEGL